MVRIYGTIQPPHSSPPVPLGVEPSAGAESRLLPIGRVLAYHPASMAKLKSFPVAVDVDGVTHDPVMLYVDDTRTQVWEDTGGGNFVVLLELGPMTNRERVKGERLGGGQWSQYAIHTEDQHRLVIGRSKGCTPCQANSLPLGKFNPESVNA